VRFRFPKTTEHGREIGEVPCGDRASIVLEKNSSKHRFEIILFEKFRVNVPEERIPDAIRRPSLPRFRLRTAEAVEPILEERPPFLLGKIHPRGRTFPESGCIFLQGTG